MQMTQIMSTKVLDGTIQEKKVLIVFDDMIADIISNIKRHSVVTELYIRRRRLNMSLVWYSSHKHTSRYQRM